MNENSIWKMFYEDDQKSMKLKETLNKGNKFTENNLPNIL